jgi:hypothetical protein
MSNLTLSTISGTVANGNKVSIPAGQVLYAPGHVIQVVSTYITTPTSVSVPASYQSYTNIPNLAATITPKSTTSKIYVIVRWFGESSAQTTNWDTMFGIKRDGVSVGAPLGGTTSIGITMASLSYYADDGNSTPEMCTFDYLDSPASVSAITYQVYTNCTVAKTLYTNRTVGAGGEFGSSSITLMEIAQ